jgi:hypothetical protein
VGVLVLMQRPRWFVLNIMSYCWVNGEERIGAHRPGPNRPRYVALRVWLALHHSLRYPPPHPMLA